MTPSQRLVQDEDRGDDASEFQLIEMKMMRNEAGEID